MLVLDTSVLSAIVRLDLLTELIKLKGLLYTTPLIIAEFSIK